MRKLLLLLLVSSLAGVGLAQVTTTVANRGSNDEAKLEAAQRSVENQLIVEEIEDAGFEIDVEEGFDEEWEEDIWVAAEADDVDANYTDPTESAKFDLADVPQADEIAEGWSEDAWENPERVVEEHDYAVANEDQDLVADDQELGSMRGEDDANAADQDLMIDSVTNLEEGIAWEDDADDTETTWWEDSNETWTLVVDEMDLDAYDAGLEEDEEDLDLLEELYNAN